METNKIYQGDSFELAKQLDDESINCIVTSPPYWALRDYGVEGQLGLEKTFQEYINRLCDLFDILKPKLRKDGTLWVNLGDTYGTKSGTDFVDDNLTRNKNLDNQKDLNGDLINNTNINEVTNGTGINTANKLRGTSPEMHKNLCNIPSRFSIEMQNRGWILRNKIIWHKPNCMPSSVKDRFTVDFEEIFFFVKNKKYWFETQYEGRITEPIKDLERIRNQQNGNNKHNQGGVMSFRNTLSDDEIMSRANKGRNKRCVWCITTKPFSEAHFATFPEELIETPIKAGCPKEGIVLDPFMGAGTTALVSLKQNKQFIGFELNQEYIQIAEKRIKPYLEQTILSEILKPINSLK